MLSVEFGQELLFPTGSAELDAAGISRLVVVLEVLRPTPYRIRVEGHTDNVPIGEGLNERYPSNWELAGARAARVVRLFEQAGVDSRRLEATSFGEVRPVAPNRDVRGRAQNRRIEIHLIRSDDAGSGS
jgi:chemotaxis protein MotB